MVSTVENENFIADIAFTTEKQNLPSVTSKRGSKSCAIGFIPF